MRRSQDWSPAKASGVCHPAALCHRLLLPAQAMAHVKRAGRGILAGDSTVQAVLHTLILVLMHLEWSGDLATHLPASLPSKHALNHRIPYTVLCSIIHLRCRQLISGEVPEGAVGEGPHKVQEL